MQTLTLDVCCACTRLLLLLLSQQITKTLTEQVSKYAQVVLDSCAYAGTGNVLKVQELLGLCGEHIETEDATAWKVRAAQQQQGIEGSAVCRRLQVRFLFDASMVFGMHDMTTRRC
jgi:hypothetical protein